MLRFKLARPILVALAACAAGSTIGTAVFADDAQDNAQLKEQMRIMMQQMQELQKQVQDLKRQQQQSVQTPSRPHAAFGRAARGRLQRPRKAQDLPLPRLRRASPSSRSS